MFHLLTNRKFLIIFGLITLLTFIVSLVLKPNAPLPEVINTSPLDRSTKVNYFDKISYKFSHDVDPQLLSLASIPEENWQKNPISPTEVVFNSAQYLQVNTQYTLTLYYQNQPLHSLAFTTIAQQSDPRYVQEVNNEIKNDYPLAVKTPYETPDFSVVYSKPLTLVITLKEGVKESNKIIDIVRGWVSQNSLDPDSHTYTFAN